jgi:hypothetical protein
MLQVSLSKFWRTIQAGMKKNAIEKARKKYS